MRNNSCRIYSVPQKTQTYTFQRSCSSSASRHRFRGVTLGPPVVQAIVVRVIKPNRLFSTMGCDIFIAGHWHDFNVYSYVPNFHKKERSFFEVFTTKGDKLIMRFLTLPWRHRCETCGKRAFYRCSECNKDICSRHRKSGKGWRLLCDECYGIDKTSTDQAAETGTNGEK